MNVRAGSLGASVLSCLLLPMVIAACTTNGDSASAAVTADAMPVVNRTAAEPNDESIVVAARCRCIPRPIAEYFEEANAVVLGRLIAVDSIGARDASGSPSIAFRLVAQTPTWRWSSRARFASAGTSEPPRAFPHAGDTLVVHTALSSASCGLGAQLGADYLLFGHHRDSLGGTAQLDVDSCSGSVIVRASPEDTLYDVFDVPGRFLISQLDALSASDALSRLSAFAPDDRVQTTSARRIPRNDSTIIGLLELREGEPLTLYERSELTSRTERVADVQRALRSREVSYEQPAAVVSVRTNDWFRVARSRGGHAWVRVNDVGAFHPVETLVVNRLSYLTAAWTGHLWSEPGAGRVSRHMRTGRAAREAPAEIHETARIGGALWLRVSLPAGDPCGGGDGRSAADGWIPAFGERGLPSTWFHSRGC